MELLDRDVKPAYPKYVKRTQGNQENNSATENKANYKKEVSRHFRTNNKK